MAEIQLKSILFVFFINIPVNQKVPLWQAVRIGVGSGPAVLQVQDKVWIRPLQDVHLNIDRFPQHFSDWIVCWSVEGAVRCLFCNQNSAVLIYTSDSALAGIVQAL